ncbi:hypothetical protein KC725_04135 [Candidatus Peregrinibacteria bacterium]|nr:hypothetical protein [Candidatus Peregrinibacteria bacterium]
MLKLIPQEEPEKGQSQSTAKARTKNNRRRKRSAGRSPKAQPANVSKKCVLTDTSNQLLTYTAGPDKYTDREISAMILSMHRSILHLEQVRLKKRNKRKGK